MAREPEPSAPVVLAPGVTATPGVQGGEPCLSGTRVPAAAVYSFWRAARRSVEAAYPEIPPAHYRLGIAFEAGRRYEREQQQRDKRRRWVGTLNDADAHRERGRQDGVAQAVAYLRAAGHADLAAGLAAALGKEGD